jgi:hypothetical protein
VNLRAIELVAASRVRVAQREEVEIDSSSQLSNDIVDHRVVFVIFVAAESARNEADFHDEGPSSNVRAATG